MTLPKEFSADQRKVGIMLFLSLDVVTFTHFKHFREWKITLVQMRQILNVNHTLHVR